MRELIAVAVMLIVLAISGGEKGAQAGSTACVLETIVQITPGC